MRKAIVEWALDASGFMMGLAVWVFPLVLVTTAVLVIFRRTRPWGGVILCYFSMLVGAATWFFGAAATFASFGWFGLIVGLLLLGLGVVPFGIIGGFIYLNGVAPTIIILLVATFAFRGAGAWLVGLGDNESKVGPLTPDQKQAEAEIGRIFDESEFSNDPEQMEKLGIELGLFKQADEDLKASDNAVEVGDRVANTPAPEPEPPPSRRDRPMAKPMSQWLDHPCNRVMFDRIEDRMNQMKSQGKFNDRRGNLDPDKMEAERNQRRLSLTEQLIQEAPDEYLDEWDLQSRRELRGESTPTS